MNKFIIEQLNKVTRANLPEWDENSTHLVIPKGAKDKKIIAEFIEGGHYVIYIDDSLVNPGTWYNTIHGNWNKGIGPTMNRVMVEVTKIMGKMLFVDAWSEDLSYHWQGWLPKANITKIKDI